MTRHNPLLALALVPFLSVLFACALDVQEPIPDAGLLSDGMPCIESGSWLITWTCIDGCSIPSPLPHYDVLTISTPVLTITGGESEIHGTVDGCVVDIELFKYTIHSVEVEPDSWPRMCVVYSGYPGPQNVKRVWCIDSVTQMT
jgi:hypothetical protein